jgi:phage replication-related protein YjqB (UPF0714/DUF867 family)
MLLINYIFAISTTLAFTDYFPNTDELFKKFKNNDKINEHNEDAEQINERDEIQVFSLAVHGGNIEKNTGKFSRMLYDKVIKIRKKSALYNFLSEISTKESGDYYNGRCIPTHCCKDIEYTVNSKKEKKPNENYDKRTCEDFKVEPKFKTELAKIETCEFKKVCYLNAGHITSEKFRTKKLNDSLHSRYPVSFHGFQDKNDEKGSPVDVVLGGLSRQKYELAKACHRLTKGAIKIAICRAGNNCTVFDPNNENFDTRTPINASGLSGSSERNFVNLGKHKCGLQLELSTTFREFKGNNRTLYWDSLVQSIINTLPKKNNGDTEVKEKERICDDERFYRKTSTDTENKP